MGSEAHFLPWPQGERDRPVGAIAGLVNGRRLVRRPPSCIRIGRAHRVLALQGPCLVAKSSHFRGSASLL